MTSLSNIILVKIIWIGVVVVLCSLPNDISGDISPEELRAVAYDNARQGVPVYQVVSLKSLLGIVGCYSYF